MTIETIKSHDEAAEKWLMSDKSSVQCSGRLIATDIPQQFEGFIASEIRRGTHPAEYFFAIKTLYCSIMASIFVEQLNPEILEQAAQEFGEITTTSLVEATLATAATESNETNKSHVEQGDAQDMEQKK